MSEFSHLDKNNQPSMVDISGKSTTSRMAKSVGKVILPKEVFAALSEDGFTTKKGSIFQTAMIAGTMAVKNTYQTIPLCHQIPISSCKFSFDTRENMVHITCIVKTEGKTGVEMESLHGVTSAALTIYDMCKALSHNITISDLMLIEKTGGKSDYHG